MANKYENEWNDKIEKLEKYIKENFKDGCNIEICDYCKIAISTDHSLCNVLMKKEWLDELYGKRKRGFTQMLYFGFNRPNLYYE